MTEERGTRPEPSSMEREPLMQALETLHDNAFSWSLHCCASDRFEAEDVLHDVYVKVLGG
jgi:DNA-directed RNA polymerase specialized sigma24 family protein